MKINEYALTKFKNIEIIEFKDKYTDHVVYLPGIYSVRYDSFWQRYFIYDNFDNIMLNADVLMQDDELYQNTYLVKYKFVI